MLLVLVGLLQTSLSLLVVTTFGFCMSAELVLRRGRAELIRLELQRWADFHLLAALLVVNSGAGSLKREWTWWALTGGGKGPAFKPRTTVATTWCHSS